MSENHYGSWGTPSSSGRVPFGDDPPFLNLAFGARQRIQGDIWDIRQGAAWGIPLAVFASLAMAVAGGVFLYRGLMEPFWTALAATVIAGYGARNKGVLLDRGRGEVWLWDKWLFFLDTSERFPLKGVNRVYMDSYFKKMPAIEFGETPSEGRQVYINLPTGEYMVAFVAKGVAELFVTVLKDFLEGKPVQDEEITGSTSFRGAIVTLSYLVLMVMTANGYYHWFSYYELLKKH